MKIHIILNAILVFFLILEDTNQHTIRKRSTETPFKTFRRDAVEHMPTWHEIIHRSMPYMEYFGSKSLPLRTAVESIPDVTASTRRLPLRDSVEKRPFPEDNNNDLDMIPDIDFEKSAFPQKPLKLTHNLLPPINYPYNRKHQFTTLIKSNYYTPVYRVDNIHQQLYQQIPFYNNRFARASKFDNSIIKQKKIICYVQSSSSYRKEPLAFEPEHLDPFACTHLIYAFANLDPHSFQVITNDDFDTVQGGYLSLTMLKQQNPELKVLLSVGGPKDLASNRYSQMVTSASRRRNFIMSLIKYIKQYKFDGADLYWLNPGDEEFLGHASDRDYYLILLEELSEIFRQHNWLLSVSVPANRFRIEDGFDPARLNQLVDFVNLQAYNFHMERSPIADHHAPIKAREFDEDLDVFNNVDYAVKFWLKRGLSREKLILGLPFFGRSFTLQSKNATGLGAPIKGPGVAGYYTQRPGFLAYFEICDQILNEKEEWFRGTDDVGSPYMTNGDQWIGYDDPDSIETKVQYMKDMELGGAFVWATDLDDFKGLCGDKWPLLRALKRGLTGDHIHSFQPEDLPTKPYGTCDSDGLYSDRRDCSSYFVCRSGFSYHLSCGAGLMFNPETGRCEYIEANKCRPGQTVHIQNSFRNLDLILRDENILDSRPKVVCYLTNWAFYRKAEGKFVPEHLDGRLCTHIVYAFASLDPETLLMKEFDPWADLDNNLYNRVTAFHDSKVLLSLGGWTDSSGDKYSRLVSDGSARRKFVVGVVSFLRKHNFDGLHLDWNYPVCWQSNCNKGAASDKPNFSKLVQELKREFAKQSPPLTLAAAISGYKEVIDVAYDLRTLGNELDFMSVMSYDYHGSWEKQTGHVSPLNSRPDEQYPQYTSKFAMEYLVQQGAPKEKLVMGVPFYGQSFTLAKSDSNSVGAPAIGPGESGEYTKQPGMLAYYEICNRVKNQYWQTNNDISGPYAYKGNQWIGYDNPQSAYEKARFVKDQGYGGIVSWTVDLDDFTNRCCQGAFPLLHAINRGLGLISNQPSTDDCRKPVSPVTPTPPTVTTGIDSGASSSEASWTTTQKTSTSTVWWVPESTTQRRTTTTRATTTTTTTPRPSWTTTVPPPAVTMPDKEDTNNDNEPKKCTGNEYQADEQNCNAYYRCILGELKKQYCVSGLHWNKERNICDWPLSAKCERRQDDTAATTWRPSTTQRTRTTTRKVITTRKPRPTTTPAGLESCNNGQYYTHEICNSFYVCVNGQLVTQRCAPGLSWHADKQMCDWGYKIKCMDRKQLAMEENEKFSKVIEAPLGLPDEECDSGSFAGYAGDCTQYLLCMWGKYKAFTCASGLHWNNERKICDWPDSAKCTEGSGTGSGEDKPVRPTKKPGTTTTTTTIKPVPEEPLPSQSGYYKIVCYFTNWAWYRTGDGKYLPEDIDPDLCTHIVYGFAVLDYSDLIIKPHDSWADLDNKFYERVVAYKKKGLKVTIAIGGWNDSAGDKYSRLVNSPSSRAKFIKNVIEFIEKYNFDGLDLDWEYPKCWQVDCNKGPDSDKRAFGDFVREIKAAFKPKGLLLSAAVSPSKTVIDAGYDVPALADALDWVAVMTYDYHGQWDKKTGHVAPMYVHPEDEVTFFNTNFTINYWISEGVPSRKIVLGMPLYGQSFRLENQNNHGLNANAPGPGEAGDFTRAAGFLAYYEICDRVKNRGWTVVKDSNYIIGPYAYHNEQWVSFDDKDMIQHKSEYIRQMNLGGGMIWALDLDDFKNRCGEGKHPLLSTIRRVLGPAPSNDEMQGVPLPPQPVIIEEDEMIDTPAVVQPIVPGPGTGVGHVNPKSEYKVVCYFTNWAWYRQGDGKYLPSDIDPDLCTHIVYGFAVLNGDEGIIKPHDTWADLDNKFYEKVTAYKAKGIKVLIAIGGWNDSAGDKYSKLVNNPSARRKFIAHVMTFIETHNFDGLDLDWEYPKCWQVDCNQGPDSDKPAFAAFVEELSAAFKPKGWLLSAAVSPARKVIDAGYEVPALSQYLDWIAVMAYDYHGQWDKVTGHVAPMYVHPEDADVTFNTNATIHYWIENGADPKKLVLGMPTYGQSFSLADNNDHGLNAPTYGGGEAGEHTRARGFLSYYEICTRIKQNGWNVVRDNKMRIGPYAYLRDQWVSFDDRDMIRHKSEYIKSMGLGGGMIWALDLDDFRDLCNCETYPLLKTINRVLRDYNVPEPDCTLEDPQKPTERPVMTTRKPTKPTTEVTWWSTEKTTQPSWTQPPSEEKPTGNLDGQPCRGNIFEAHESDCNAYYYCIHNVLRLQRCSGGLFWAKDHCDWPENSGCHSDLTPAPQPIVIKPQPEITTLKPPYKPSKVTTARPGSIRDGKKVICYFTNWAWYRQGLGKYVPEDIDGELCTHINYGFAVLDPNTLTIKTHDSWADIDNKFYERVVAYKAKGIKVLIAIGGWNDSLGNKYSRLVNDPAARARFIANVCEFIEKWGFDGLDLDWEYPKCWQTDCDAGPDSDKPAFAQFVAELRQTFNQRGWLLSAAVSPSKLIIDEGYAVASLSQNFDWIAVMTYDYHGQWDKKTGHHAPMYYYPGDEFDYFNINFTLNYWRQQGADPGKLIMGMPLYGQSFSLADPNNHGMHAPAYGPGEAGEFTRAAGFLSFYEICSKVKGGGWNVVRDAQERVGPYAYSGNQWVGYDDIADVRRKSQAIKDWGLGGGMVWALDLDDFQNVCGCGKNPLLRNMNNVLRGVPLDGQQENCT